jgi:hypothetical protein
LPIFLMIMFGVMEFGNLFLAKNQVNTVAQAVADYLEASPSATNNQLTAFTASLGLGILKNTGPGEGNEISQKLKIKSSKTMFTATQFDELCSGGAIKDYSNPWASDPVLANRTKPYYIHVCYNYTYPPLTPLAKLIGTASDADKILNGKALAYISKERPTCAANQFLKTDSLGAYTCATIPVCTGPNRVLRYDSGLFTGDTGGFYCGFIDAGTCTGANQALRFDGLNFYCDNLLTLPTNCSAKDKVAYDTNLKTFRCQYEEQWFGSVATGGDGKKEGSGQTKSYPIALPGEGQKGPGKYCALTGMKTEADKTGHRCECRVEQSGPGGAWEITLQYMKCDLSCGWRCTRDVWR